MREPRPEWAKLLVLSLAVLFSLAVWGVVIILVMVALYRT